MGEGGKKPVIMVFTDGVSNRYIKKSIFVFLGYTRKTLIFNGFCLLSLRKDTIYILGLAQ